MSTHSILNQETDLIQKRPLKEDIFDVLHEKIISGAYKPGDWLRQDDIATQLGVSMTPVREALDLLVSSGLAERVPYRGVRVREISGEGCGRGVRLAARPRSDHRAGGSKEYNAGATGGPGKNNRPNDKA
jgi:DNA-binding FadR family transcriptional regulator